MFAPLVKGAAKLSKPPLEGGYYIDSFHAAWWLSESVLSALATGRLRQLAYVNGRVMNVRAILEEEDTHKPSCFEWLCLDLEMCPFHLTPEARKVLLCDPSLSCFEETAHASYRGGGEMMSGVARSGLLKAYYLVAVFFFS